MLVGRFSKLLSTKPTFILLQKINFELKMGEKIQPSKAAKLTVEYDTAFSAIANFYNILNEEYIKLGNKIEANKMLSIKKN